MMDITKTREEFHKWLEEVHGLYGEDIDWQPERNCYRIFGIHLAWCAWQASRESLVVELPKRNAGAYTERDWDGNHGGRSRNNTLEECAEVLRTAGIRIKGESE